MMSASNLLDGIRSGLDSVLSRFAGIRGGTIISGSVIVGLITLGACSSDAKYFQDRVNEVTQAAVGKRYGAPHKVQSSADGNVIWTYFERGSGTAGFSGQVRKSVCQAYVLTFDKQTVLREWQMQSCEG
jgi:hypothetical protein